MLSDSRRVRDALTEDDPLRYEAEEAFYYAKEDLMDRIDKYRQQSEYCLADFMFNHLYRSNGMYLSNLGSSYSNKDFLIEFSSMYIEMGMFAAAEEVQEHIVDALSYQFPLPSGSSLCAGIDNLANLYRDYANRALALPLFHGVFDGEGGEYKAEELKATLVLRRAALRDRKDLYQLLEELGLIYISFDHVDNNESSANSVMLVAAELDATNLMQRVIEGGVDMDKHIDEKNTALHIAARCGSAKVLHLLLDSGVSLDARGEAGLTAIHLASEFGNNTIVWMLLQKEADTNLGTASGNTPLHKAVQRGYLNIAQMLLDAGAAPDIIGGEGLTSLQLACAKSHAAVRMLLEKGANVNAVSKSSNTALHYAVMRGDMYTVDMYIVNILLDFEAKLEIVGEKGLTALQLACASGHNAFVQKLLEKGANVNAISGNHWSALHLASDNGHNNTISILLDKGADLHARTAEGETALHLASRQKWSHSVSTLLVRGANPNTRTTSGETALHIVSSAANNEMIISSLLQKGADPNLQTTDSETALHMASRKRLVHNVSMLLDNGANPNLQTNFGWTALHIACYIGHHDVVNTLQGNTIDPNAQTANNSTALHVAATKRYMAIGRDSQEIVLKLLN